MVQLNLKFGGTPRHVRCRRRCRVLALALLLAVAVNGCSSGSDAEATAGTRSRKEIVPVTVATAVEKDVPVQVRAIGNVEPYSTVSVKSQVEGQLAEVHFQEGDRVASGELLFTIDPRPFQAALEQAQANLQKDLAEAKNAEVDAKRRAELLAKGFVSPDESDSAQARAASLRAAVDADKAAVDTAKLRLQYCYIRSPIDGRIGQLLAHRGNVVKANDTLLVVINQVRPVYVSFSVPEQELPQIRARAATQTLQVQAFLPNHEADAPVTGELSFINNTVDTTTGTIMLKGTFSNTDEALWPGQFVDIVLTLTTRPKTVLVPSQAVQTGQQGPYVFVVTPDLTAEVRPVVPGDTIGSDTIIAKGLAPGERVVTDGQVRLAPGFKVELKGAVAGNSQPLTDDGA